LKKIEENNLLVQGQLMLEDMAVLEVHSKSNKAFDFLQGQVTSDISTLNKDNAYQLSSTCNQKGQVVADFVINRSGNDYKIIIKNELVELFINDLEPYAKFFSVNFIKNKDYVHGYAVKRKHEESLLKNETFGLSVKCSRDKIVGTLTKEDWVTNNLLLGNYNISAIDSGKFRPAEIMQDKTRVSFNKGCFRGQEIIARMRYLGKEKTSMRLVISSNALKIENRKITNLLSYETQAMHVNVLLGNKNLVDALINSVASIFVK
jgi:folate-binding protein YgfZ